MTKYVYVGRRTGPDIVLPADQIVNQTVQHIRQQILKTTEALWIRTRDFSAQLNDQGIPSKRFPQIIIDRQVNVHDRPPSYLYVGSTMSSEVVVLYFQVTSDAGEHIPAISLDYLKREIAIKTVKDMYERISSAELNCTVKQVTVNGRPVDPNTKIKSFIDVNKDMPRLGVQIELTDAGKAYLEKRAHVVEELSVTEANYVSVLKCLKEFWRPQFEAKGLLNGSELVGAFDDIEKILDAHQKFHAELSNAVHGYSSVIGGVFLRNMARFEVSSHFVANYQNVIEDLAVRKQSKAFAAALEELKHMQDDREFTSFLVNPVQRLPRYSLLLKAVAKNTHAGHPDSELLVKAQKELDDLIQSMDELTRKVKEQSEQRKLQEKIRKDGGIWQNFKLTDKARTIFCKTKVSVMRQPGKKIRPGIIYLFNDMVLLIKDRGRSAKVYFKDEVKSFHWLTVPRDYRSVTLVSFLVDRERCDRSEFLVSFTRSDEKDEFFSQVIQLQSSLLKNLADAFMWRVDSLADIVETICQHSAVVSTDKLIFFGGMTNSQKLLSSDLMTFSHDDNIVQNVPLSQMTTHESSIPPRRKHTMTYLGGCLYIIGGIMKPKEPCYIVQFNIAKKSIVNCCKAATINRYGHTCVPYNNQLFVFGGKVKPSTYLNDVTVVDMNRQIVMQIQSTDPRPEGRSEHSAVIYNERMYIFGGKGQKGLLSDLWSFDLKNFEWRQEKLPSKLTPRRAHLAVMLADEMVLIGGFPGNYTRIPTEAVNLTRMRTRKVENVGNVPPCLKHMAGGVMQNKTLVIYGGLEFKCHTPQSTIYQIELTPNWMKKVMQYEATRRDIPEVLDGDAWNRVLGSSCCHTVLAHRSTWMPQKRLDEPKARMKGPEAVPRFPSARNSRGEGSRRGSLFVSPDSVRLQSVRFEGPIDETSQKDQANKEERNATSGGQTIRAATDVLEKLTRGDRVQLSPPDDKGKTSKPLPGSKPSSRNSSTQPKAAPSNPVKVSEPPSKPGERVIGGITLGTKTSETKPTTQQKPSQTQPQQPKPAPDSQKAKQPQTTAQQKPAAAQPTQRPATHQSSAQQRTSSVQRSSTSHPDSPRRQSHASRQGTALTSTTRTSQHDFRLHSQHHYPVQRNRSRAPGRFL